MNTLANSPQADRLQQQIVTIEDRILSKQIDQGDWVLTILRFSDDPLADLAEYCCNVESLYRSSRDVMQAAIAEFARLQASEKQRQEARVEELRRAHQ